MPLPSAKRRPTSYAAVGSPLRAAARSAGPPIASGRRSLGGIGTKASLLWPGTDCRTGIVPVTSAVLAGNAEIGGIATEAVVSGVSGTVESSDCRPIGPGGVAEGTAGTGITGLALLSAGDGDEDCGSLGAYLAGVGGGGPLSSSDM